MFRRSTRSFKHDIGVVVDRLVVRPDIATRLAESLETALDLADGIAEIEFAEPVEGHGPGLTFLVEIRLPGVWFHDLGDRAAAVSPSTIHSAPAPPAPASAFR